MAEVSVAQISKPQQIKSTIYMERSQWEQREQYWTDWVQVSGFKANGEHKKENTLLGWEKTGSIGQFGQSTISQINSLEVSK